VTRMLGDKFTFTGTKPRDTMHLKFGKIVCFVAAFCAATAVVAAAQTLTTLVRFDKTDGSEYWGLIRLIDPMSGFVTGLLKISNPMDPSVPFYSDDLWNQALRSKTGC